MKELLRRNLGVFILAGALVVGGGVAAAVIGPSIDEPIEQTTPAPQPKEQPTPTPTEEPQQPVQQPEQPPAEGGENEVKPEENKVKVTIRGKEYEVTQEQMDSINKMGGPDKVKISEDGSTIWTGEDIEIKKNEAIIAPQTGETIIIKREP